MEYELDTGAHSVYSLDYHLILNIKYRRSVLNDERTDLLRRVTEQVSESYDVHIKNMEHDEDHVHILFRTKPTTDIPKYINSVEHGATAYCTGHVQVKLGVDDSDEERLRGTFSAFREACQYTVDYAWNNRTDDGHIDTRKTWLHEQTYDDIKERTGTQHRTDTEGA